MDLKRIVVATDFSEASLLALETALGLAFENDSRLYLVHVGMPFEADQSDLRQNLEERLNQLIQQDYGVPIEGVILYGTPAEEVARFAAENSADLIVAGTHGRKGLSRMILGSTAEELLKQAPCQLLVNRPKQEE